VENKLIVRGDPRDVALLRACYGMLFPDCRIQVLEKRVISFEEDAPAEKKTSAASG
jgi:hypothetical protein